MKTTVKLAPFLTSVESQAFGQIRMKWSDILQRVKGHNISTHAWFVNGDPVAAADNTILVAFKNSIHRETTEKPVNREVIEGVLQEVFGRPGPPCNRHAQGMADSC